MKNIGSSDIEAAELSEPLDELFTLPEVSIKDDVGECSVSVDEQLVECTLALPADKSADVKVEFEAGSPRTPMFHPQFTSLEGRYGHFAFANGQVLDVVTFEDGGHALLNNNEPLNGEWSVVFEKDKVEFSPLNDSDLFLLKLSCPSTIDEARDPDWHVVAYSIKDEKETCSAVVVENEACIVSSIDGKIFCDATQVVIMETKKRESSSGISSGSNDIEVEAERLIKDHVSRRHLLRRDVGE